MGPSFAWKRNARDRRIVLSTGGPTLLMRPPTSWRRAQTNAKKKANAKIQLKQLLVYRTGVRHWTIRVAAISQWQHNRNLCGG